MIFFSTNLPKETMLFDNFPFPDYDGSRGSFVPHQNVLRYIEDFAQPIRHVILVRKYLITIGFGKLRASFVLSYQAFQ